MKISDNTFNNSPIITGGTNVINYGDSKKIDWESLTTELKAVLKLLPQNSQEFEACQEALIASSTKQPQKLSQVIKQYLPQFTSDLFSGTASGILVAIISQLIVK